MSKFSGQTFLLLYNRIDFYCIKILSGIKYLLCFNKIQLHPFCVRVSVNYMFCLLFWQHNKDFSVKLYLKLI